MNTTRARWWEGAVLYQVYVRSFRDSDGDGYGDLRGLAERLDHLVDLGVDGIWLSPTMPSPDDDWGYDVSDYLDVHPELGTLEDLDSLVTAAGARGLAVLLDLVPNHTSSAHPWFVEASSSPDSPRRDYYVWADPAFGGGPPNNWRDSTGEPAWTFDERSGQYYLHNFLASQPDLNWWNPEVHGEFDAILAFWFERGIAGVRIDVVHGIYKDAELRDNPAPEPGAEQWAHGGQVALYNANRPETHALLRRWRALADSFVPPRLLLGETWVGDLDRLAAFYGDDDELQLGFNFPFLFAELSAPGLASVVDATLSALPSGACPVWAASNHDAGRFPSRWAHGDEALARLALVVLLTLPGTSVLYYGDEILMTDVEVPRALQRDAMTAGGRGGKPNRDRCRTPMVWDPSPGAGFAPEGASPWLPVGERSRNVADQVEAAKGSGARPALELCRRLVELRHEHLRGVPGLETLALDEGLWSYAVGPLVVHANFSALPRSVTAGTAMAGTATAGAGALDLLESSLGRGARRHLSSQAGAGADGTLELEPREAVVLGPAGIGAAQLGADIPGEYPGGR